MLRKEVDADVPGWILVLSKPETMLRPNPENSGLTTEDHRRPHPQPRILTADERGGTREVWMMKGGHDERGHRSSVMTH